MNKVELKKYKKKQSKISDKRINLLSYPHDLRIVAEGDSWFDYPLRKDIIDYLIEKGYAIKKFAKAGDTLENMIYGGSTKKRNGQPARPTSESFQTTMTAIKTIKPKVFLFSGGGNDIVGSEILGYLNHALSDAQYLVNTIIFEEKLKHIKRALEYLIQSVHKNSSKTHILMDGYDYAKVNGKAYEFLFFKVKGPWLEPSFHKKSITQDTQQKEIIKYLVDEFNEMLIELDNKYSYFHHINLRGKFPNDSQWDNEIHLENAGYQTVANLYHERICELLTHDPVKTHKNQIFV